MPPLATLAAHYGILFSKCQAAALLSVLQETKISLFKTRKCVNTILLLTVLCVDIMRHSDVFEAYDLFTF